MSALLRQFDKRRQSGATAVELALVLIVFLLIAFGILEFGRVFYLVSTIQEVTRHAARQQVVNWSTATAGIQRTAVFGSSGQESAVLPAGGEVSDANVRITFHTSLADAYNDANPITPAAGSDAQSNFDNCLIGNTTQCIKFVRATLVKEVAGPGQVTTSEPVIYSPMIPIFDFLAIELPSSTVIMPAESLGLP